MIINFIGNFQTGYVGEIGDAVHLADELEGLGHKVRRIPQDAWREYVLEDCPPDKYDVPKDLKADINIICKWHHFYNGIFINKLREFTKAPVFYWVWDYMRMEDWHMNMVVNSDLYLGNDVRNGMYRDYKNCYYFPFDVADRRIKKQEAEKKYDVSFFGSWIGEGDRQKWLTEINKTNPITVFSWNHQDWPPEFDAHEPVYGDNFAKRVAESKIILGFNVEPNCWGYWSNRMGKTLLAGGFLLQQYAPGMELFLRDGAEYFSSIEEATEKIDFYLISAKERENIANRGHRIAQERFSSRERCKDLTILIERFLKRGGVWQI